MNMEMEKYIAAFPKGMREAVNHSANLSLKKTEKDIQNVVITGLGGSGI